MTELGTTGTGGVAQVDASGVLRALGAATAVDWWVGAEDRWHHASSEPAVRQWIAGDEVTLETRLKVPGGDVVHRITVVPDGGGASASVEIENETPVPVAVAVAVAVPGPSRVFDDTLRSGDRVLLRASRGVARAISADGEDTLRRVVEAGEAQPPSEGDGELAGGSVALIFPLPHTAILRLTVPLDDGAKGSAPQDLPPMDAVARGWEQHLGSAATMALPDDRLLGLVASARRHLLVGSAKAVDHAFWTDGCEPWVAPVAAAALDAWGHHLEARELLLAAVGADDLAVHAARGVAEAGALLWAWAERLERRPDPELEAALGPWIAETAVGLLRRRRGWFGRRGESGDGAWRAVGLAAAGSVLTRGGDTELGPDIVDAIPQLVADADADADGDALAFALAGGRVGMEAPPLLDALGRLLDLEAPTFAALGSHAGPAGALEARGRTAHPLASALVLLALRRAVLDEPMGTGGTLALLAHPDAGWMGTPMEAHRIPVTGGRVSFGARWHGERPALLWEVDGPGTVELAAPGLDGQWRSSELRGEALLGPTPGLVAEAGPETPEATRGAVIDPEDHPDSFA